MTLKTKIKQQILQLPILKNWIYDIRCAANIEGKHAGNQHGYNLGYKDGHTEGVRHFVSELANGAYGELSTSTMEQLPLTEDQRRILQLKNNYHGQSKYRRHCPD